ncbi:MAG: hypothetical protein F6J94_09245 [Moorea sp. SIO1F2]|nr:hypothetical protein [Moorena sp. SIO1F2]
MGNREQGTGNREQREQGTGGRVWVTWICTFKALETTTVGDLTPRAPAPHFPISPSPPLPISPSPHLPISPHL